MEIDIFGKEDCTKCEAVKNDLKSFISDKKLADKVKLSYIDMESVDGMAEGAFHDVLNIPTVIMKNRDKKVARWDGNISEMSEVESVLKKEMS